MSHIEALREAIEIAGGQGKFGAIFGKAQQTVAYYLASEKGLPAEFVLAAEEATGVPRWRLRPDIYPLTLPASPAAGALVAAGA